MDDNPTPVKKPKKKKTLWKRFSRWFQKKVGPTLAPPLGSLIIDFISLTSRKKVYGLFPFREACESGRPVIFSFWHGRMLLLPVFYKKYVSRQFFMLISQHTDGEMIARAIDKFGIPTVRGSSRRGGKEVFIDIVKKLKSGRFIGFTPDGPTGPGEIAKHGVIEAAFKSKAVIFPVTYGASRQYKLPTWDKFVIPAPFSNVAFVIDEPIELTGEETPEQREEIRLLLEKRMTAIGEEAERLAKNG